MRTKAIVTITSIYLAAALVAACASKPTESKNETPAAGAKPTAPSSNEIRDRYTISQLDSAANALKIVADSSKDMKHDGGTEIIGCPLTVAKANAMRMPIRSLIENRIYSERDSYSADPTQYGDSNSFETCAVTCSCGVLSEIVRGARTGSFKAKDAKYHERWTARLKLKSTTLGERELKTCAMKQTWICGSDLMKYLESQTLGAQ